MKGKLIKTDVNYLLEDENGVVVASTSLKRVEGLSLSLKNCQAIERGYDLDELTENFWKQEFIKPGIIDTNSFKQGFQKALELLGDKKFSYEDMEKVFVLGVNSKTELHARDKAIQSLQQTEWDVEVEMEKIMLGRGCWKKQQKFDSDGCLTLKTI